MSFKIDKFNLKMTLVQHFSIKQSEKKSKENLAYKEKNYF